MGSRFLTSRAASREEPTGPTWFDGLGETARQIRDLSIRAWNVDRAVEIVGESPLMIDLLQQLEKIAPYNEPVLVLGESGVGKELLAQALYLRSGRVPEPFVSVNCPQFQEGNLTVSELFGHKRGSFTGAVTDRKGCFETAGTGVIFLDEIGDLHVSAQMMLLRTLASGEFQPLGAETPRRARARVVAATNRSLNELARDKHFRRDLLFRLRHFLLQVPPLRERGDDWRLLLEYALHQLHQRYGVKKRFSTESLQVLEGYSWPGNIRELIGLTTTAYALCDGAVLEPPAFLDYLELGTMHYENRSERLFNELTKGRKDFWRTVKQPFLDRDLNRSEVRRIISLGLRQTRGSYRGLLEMWRLPADDYQKFMDFLRHHRLKPRSS